MFLEIVLGVLVLVCAVVAAAALWPTRPRSHARGVKERGGGPR
ncbi:hypothetical protein [Herbidospora cretacea]|nr:hypothetical protein [Herbidospora cretacea]